MNDFDQVMVEVVGVLDGKMVEWLCFSLFMYGIGMLLFYLELVKFVVEVGV